MRVDLPKDVRIDTFFPREDDRRPRCLHSIANG
jgi:hypothetical protein